MTDADLEAMKAYRSDAASDGRSTCHFRSTAINGHREPSPASENLHITGSRQVARLTSRSECLIRPASTSSALTKRE
jgi:hypothetical protein